MSFNLCIRFHFQRQPENCRTESVLANYILKAPDVFCDTVLVMLMLQNLQCSSWLVNTVTQLQQHMHPFQRKKKAHCGRTGREKNPRPASFHEVKTVWHACLKLSVFILEMLSKTISVSRMPKYCRIYAALLLAEMEMMGEGEMCICRNSFLPYSRHLNMDRLQQTESKTSCISFLRKQIYYQNKEKPLYITAHLYFTLKSQSRSYLSSLWMSHPQPFLP